MLHNISNTLLENTLAFFLVTDDEKALLRQLFSTINSRVEVKLGSIQKYSSVMLPAADADLIIDWISDNNINTEKKAPKELLDPIENLFEMVFPSLELKKVLRCRGYVAIHMKR